MEYIGIWLDQLKSSSLELVSAFVGILPQLLGAVLLLALGWVFARIARRGASALVRTVNTTLIRLINRGRSTRVHLPPQTPKLVGDVVFWVIILFFVTAAAKTAQFDVISIWLERVVSYVPTLVAGVVIVWVGYLLSTLAREVVTGAAASAGFVQNRFIGTIAQAATFLTAFVIGLDQIGMDVTFLVTIIAIALSASLAGLSIAFGLGARAFADNLITARSIQRQYQRGQTIRLGDLEGEILDLTSTGVIIASDHGRSTIPARLFNDQVSVLVTPEETDG